jgi:hypothetical protein
MEIILSLGKHIQQRNNHTQNRGPRCLCVWLCMSPSTAICISKDITVHLNKIVTERMVGPDRCYEIVHAEEAPLTSPISFNA